jgi:hypothetical protein
MENSKLTIIIIYKDTPFDPNNHMIRSIYDLQEAINIIQEYCSQRDFKVEEKIILQYDGSNILEIDSDIICPDLFKDEFQLFALFNSKELIEKSHGYYNFPQDGWKEDIKVKRYPHYFKILLKSDISDDIEDKEVKRRILAIFKDYCNRSLNQYIAIEPGVMVDYNKLKDVRHLSQDQSTKIAKIIREVRKKESEYEDIINNIEDPKVIYDYYVEGPDELFVILDKYQITRPTEFKGENI